MNEVICIFGKRGSGKTTLAKKLLLGRKRLIIFDTLREYKVGLVTDNLITLYEFLTLHEFNQICRVSYSPEDIGHKEAFIEVCKMLYTMKDLTFLVEEVDNYCNDKWLPDIFKAIVFYGRHYNLSLITIARRSADVSKDLTSQATDFYIFAHHEPRDIKYFADLFNSEVADRIRTLGQFEYMHLKPELATHVISEVVE